MDENQTENLDSENEEVIEEVVETVEQTDDELEKLREQNKRLFERTKKAEAEAKALKAQPAPPITTPSVDADELKLIARGLSDEEIEKAKVIAKGNGTTLNEALKDDMFLAYQEKRKEDARKEKAKLGASKGSGQETEDQGIKPGMTREEHIAKFKEITQA